MNKNRIVVYSDQPYSDKKLDSIFVGEVEDNKELVLLVIVGVGENSVKKMESVSNMLDIRSPISLGEYRDNVKEDSDREYVFKEDFMSSFKKFLGIIPANVNANMMAPAF